MRNKFEKMRFEFAYELISYMVSFINCTDYTELEEDRNLFLFDDPDECLQNFVKTNIDLLLKPNMNTILHEFIKLCFWKYFDIHYYSIEVALKNIDGTNYICNIFENIFLQKLKNHGIDTKDKEFLLFDLTDKYYETEEASYEEYVMAVIDILDDCMDLIKEIETVTIQSVFYILFADKDFLYTFSSMISYYFNDLVDTLPENENIQNGRIKRCRFPEWVKRAIEYRDFGRCQSCFKDLTNQTRRLRDNEKQIDHIIPLAKAGQMTQQTSCYYVMNAITVKTTMKLNSFFIMIMFGNSYST